VTSNFRGGALFFIQLLSQFRFAARTCLFLVPPDDSGSAQD
jgi:hypothetical protein